MNTMRTLSAPALFALLLAGCTYEPPVRAKGDRWRQEGTENTLRGSLHLLGPEVPKQAMILVFDADNPGPPEGTSGPVDFTVVRPEEFVGEPVYGFRAEWAAVEVPDGEYLIDAIVDMDEDFSPVLFTLGGATCGDWQGSHFGVNQGTPTATTTVTVPDTGAPDPVGPVFGKGRVVVSGGQVVSGIAVEVREELLTERPAFVFSDPAGYARISLEAAGTEPLPPTFNLRSTGIHVQYTDDPADVLELADPCEVNGARECVPETTCEGAISLYYPDADGNGVMDPHPDYPLDFGLKDVWPRVFMEYLGPVELGPDGEVVRDEYGYPVIGDPGLPEGESWGTEAFTFGVEAAGFGLPLAPIGVPTKVRDIDVMFPPLVARFLDRWDPALCEGDPPEDPDEGCTVLVDLTDPAQRAAVPRGAWSVNLISWTGQTWGLPNEISEMGLPSTAESFNPASQGGFVYVVD